MARCIAVLSDIHGHLTALEAVLSDAIASGAEAFVVAGDMVGLGPRPDRVVDRLSSLGAQMIRGNHEADYVAPYERSMVPPEWLTESRYSLRRWEMDTLGATRRALLAALPDRLEIDNEILVVHGSPLHMREAVFADTPADVLEERHKSESASLFFSGHSHRPVIRELPERRFVNVGSVGLSLDGDPSADYTLMREDRSRNAKGWQLEQRRIPYDIDAAIASMDGAFRASSPEMAEVITRTVRTGRDYIGPAFRFDPRVTDDAFRVTLQRYLAANP